MVNWLLVLAFIFALSGCVSQVVSFRDHIESWKGESMSSLLEARSLPHADRSDYKGVERVSGMDNGHLLYELPYKKCPVFFEVDEKGIIVDISTENNQDCY